jgi:predicted ATP-dependent serine protease
VRSLVSALHRTGGRSIPLPDRFPSLAKEGIRFRRQQVTMIAGQPGSGKSLLALDYAIHANVNTLYFSADSDGDTVLNRVGAMKLDTEVVQVEDMREQATIGLLEDELATLTNVRFCFDPSPTLEVIDLELRAWNEVYGEQPDLIIIDNLINIQSENQADEWGSLRDLCKTMHEIARSTGAAVIVLHHTSEQSGTGGPNLPQPRAALQGKLSALPELILTIAIDPSINKFFVSAVKNRSGKADALARNYISLDVNLSKMELKEVPVAPPPPPISVRRAWDEINNDFNNEDVKF